MFAIVRLDLATGERAEVCRVPFRSEARSYVDALRMERRAVRERTGRYPSTIHGIKMIGTAAADPAIDGGL